MDLNLSKICDMLAERIEEYKSTSKKRRIVRGSGAPKEKHIKIGKYQADDSMRRDVSRLYTSTPIEAPRSTTKEFTTLPAMFSTIAKVTSQETPRRERKRKLNINVRKLTFDDAEKDEVDSNSKTASVTSPASFSSVTKISPHDLLKRRCLRGANVNVRKLSFSDEKSKDLVEGLLPDFVDEVTLKQDQLSLNMSNRLQSQCPIQTRRLTFDYDMVEDMVKRSPNNCADEEQLKEILSQSSLDTCKRINIRRLTFDVEEQDPVDSFMDESSAEATLIQGGESIAHSIMMELNVGISLYPLRNK